MSFGTSRVYRCENTDRVCGLLFSQAVEEHGKKQGGVRGSGVTDLPMQIHVSRP